MPVSEWYNFNLLAKYKALTAEEAEVAFEKRHKIQNYSLVMKSMKLEPEAGDQKPKKSSRRSGGFRVTDMDDMDDDSEGSGPGDGSGDEDKSSRKKKAGSSKRKNKKGSDDEYDSDPGEESGNVCTLNHLLIRLHSQMRVTSISGKWITFRTRRLQTRKSRKTKRLI